MWVLTAPPLQTIECSAVVRLKGPAPGFPGGIGLDFKIDVSKSFSVKKRRLDRCQGFHASGYAKGVALIGSRVKSLVRVKAADG